MKLQDYQHRFTFNEWATPPLHANQSFSHWAVKARVVKMVRNKAAEMADVVPALGKCRVQLTWYVNDKKRRDADNLWPLLKALCDGLVDAGVVEDDTPEFMDKPQPQITFVEKQIMPAHICLEVEKIS